MLPYSNCRTKLSPPPSLPRCSQDNQVVLWDIRRANGPLLSLDQHNGGGASSNVASES